MAPCRFARRRLLGSVGLEERVRRLPEGLDAPITEGGDNLSSGERQLLCLARSILPFVDQPQDGRSGVLICDEVTSAVDGQSDERGAQIAHMPSSLAQLVELIERALLAVLSTLLGLPITVLYICHRLQHVDHFDLVLVLDEGSGTSHSPANFSTRAWECSAAACVRAALELGPPAEMLARPTSRLAEMVTAQQGR